MDLAAEEAGDLAADRQTEPRAAVASCGRAVGLLEGLEDQSQLVLGHADAGVGDGEGDDVVGVLQGVVHEADAGRGAGDAQRHPPSLGELEGVGQQVAEDLLQPLLISEDGAGHVVGHVGGSAVSSSPTLAISISAFLISMLRFCSASRAAFSCNSSLVCCSSSCWVCSSSDWLCSSRVRRWDCSSNSSVRMLAMIVESTTPIVSVSWSRNVWCTSLNGRNEASSMTASTWSSKSTGTMMMFTGSASPRPEVILM